MLKCSYFSQGYPFKKQNWQTIQWQLDKCVSVCVCLFCREHNNSDKQTYSTLKSKELIFCKKKMFIC